MTSQITLDPDPPEKGKNCKIGSTGPYPAHYRYRIDNDSWVSFTLDQGETLDVAIPSSANALIVEDNDGNAPYRNVPCV
jgi:hypothetical protein